MTYRIAEAADRAAQGAPPALVGLVTALIVVLRQTAPIVRPEFLWEEAAAWWAPTFVLDPVTYLLTPWNGFLYPPLRAVYLLGRLGPPAVAPVVTFTVFLAVIVAVAAFVASDRLADALPDRRVRIAAALAVALLPFRGGVYFYALQIVWFAAIYLAALAIARPGRSDRIGVALCALIGPIGAVAAPLFLLRRRFDLAAILTVGGLIQVATLIGSSRRPASGSLLDVLAAVPIRIGVTPIGDVPASYLVSAAPIAFGVIGLAVLGLVVAVVWPLRRSTIVALAWMAVAIAAIGMFGGPRSELWAPGTNRRYFIVVAWAIIVVALVATSERRRLGMLLLGVCCIGIFATLRRELPPDRDWARQSSCIGGPTPCVVTVYPAEWSVEWTPGSYRVPIAARTDGPGPSDWLTP